MAKSSSVQNSFLSGELSPLLLGNTSIQQYYQGLRQGLNAVVVPQGGIKRRGGLNYAITPLNTLTRYTATLPTMPNGGTAANINDGDSSTTTATTTNISTINPYVVAQYDLVTARRVELIDVNNISLSTLSSNEFEIEHSDDGSVWTGGYTKITVNPTAYSKRVTIAATHRFWRLVRIGATDLGTDKVTLSEFNILFNSGTLSNVKTFGVSVETGLDYLGVITDGNLRITRNLGSTFDAGQNIPVPYLSSEISEVRVKVIGDVVLLFHGEHPVKRVINYGEEGVATNKNPIDEYYYWYTDEAPFLNVPQYDFDDSLSPTPVAEVQNVTFGSFTIGMKYQVDVEGIFSKLITYAGDSTAAERSSTAFNLQKNLQDMPNFGETGITVSRIGTNQYEITMDGESAGSYELFSGFNTSGGTSATMTFVRTAVGTARKEDIWGPNRGYPKMGEFHEGRLWLGGTRDKPQTLLASKSGSLLDFELGEGDDDQGMFITISSRGDSTITDIYSGRNMLIFSASGEYAILNQNVTPSTVNVRNQTSNGSLSVEVQEADGSVIYCDSNAKTLREYVYSFNEDAYGSTDISVLSSHLIKTPVAMAFLTGTGSDDANWLFIVNADGTASILNKLRAQDINAFTPMTTNGELKDCCVFGEDVAFVVDRDINGVTNRFIERWDFNYLMDSSVRTAVTGSTLSGFDHLEGETVVVSVDNTILSSRVVSGGNITLTAEESASYDSSNTLEAGLNFEVTIEPMPINTNIGSGENFMRLKKIVRINLRVLETAGMYVDGVPVPSRTFGLSTLDEPVEKFTGILRDIYPVAGWNRDIMPIMTFPDPTPFHIQAIEFEVESS